MKNEVNRAFMAKKKIFIYSLAALSLMACGKKETSALQEEERVEQVRTTVLQPREIEREISVSTNLQGYITQNVAPSLTGKIEHIYREVGDRVSAGSDLVRMDQTQYKTTKISMANLTIEKNRIENEDLHGEPHYREEPYRDAAQDRFGYPAAVRPDHDPV